MYAAHDQAVAHHLIDVHDGLRAELRQLRDLIDQVAAGLLDPAAARSHINVMTLRQNNWTLGTYCESYCRIVTGHHSLEDASVFPHLRSSDPRLAPVIDRLKDEHVVIHDVLESVDQALVRLVTANDVISSAGGRRPADRHLALTSRLRGARAHRTSRAPRFPLMPAA